MKQLTNNEIDLVDGGLQALASFMIGGAGLGAEIGAVGGPGGMLAGALIGAGAGFIGWCAAAGSGAVTP